MDVVLYTDGSRGKDGAIGYGYAVYQDGRTQTRGFGRLRIAEVFDAEAEGVRHGLRAALRGRMPPSSRDALLEAREAAALRAVSFEWIPGHEGIPGNEHADQLAKQGSKQDPPVPAPRPTAAGVRRIAKRRAEKAFSA
ncbi:reverse transcriptase domain protein [Colletotrichum musicola]|uniref:Reverse transcriptase domain protein n=1 Tax=Colletotrichum musicola TaxID=2175873 RepID=A0A8H6NVF0_9PEZI|nr:reverse transcriptase domain protein [Colletotrichum musicola]